MPTIPDRAYSGEGIEGQRQLLMFVLRNRRSKSSKERI